MKKAGLALLMGLMIGWNAPCQVDSTALPEDLIQGILEDFMLNQEEESEFDYTTMLERLEQFYENPVNLNEATAPELAELGLLSDLQIQSLNDYRTQIGRLIVIYELQAVPFFDLATIRRILPFVTVDDSPPVLESFSKIWAQSKNQTLTRWSRLLETQAGFLITDTLRERYLGDKNRYLLTVRRRFGAKFSMGFTAEKDIGEEFFKGANRHGFDFYSGHFYWRDIGEVLKTVALGDFAPTFGQGLILYSGFAAGKVAEATAIKRRSEIFRPYSSVNEVDFFRGAGATVAFGKSLTASAFASFRQRDANIFLQDTTDNPLVEEAASSFQITGFHRTPGEITDENALNNFTTGGNLTASFSGLKIAANFLFNRFNKPVLPSAELYNLYRFSGRQLVNASVDYSYAWRNLNFFGETAMSDNGGWATLNGLMLGLGKQTSLSFLQRHFEPEFQSLNGQAFAESQVVQNESGLFTGFQIVPNRNWKMSGYFDFWRHPWLRFNVDAPSKGREWLVKLTYSIPKNLEIYLLFRQETKERNAVENSTKTDYLINISRTYLRLNLSCKLLKFMELRSRVEWSYVGRESLPDSRGFMAYQDVLFRPQRFPVSLLMRLAVFETDDYDSRIFAYENDIQYSFSIPSFYGRGMRFYAVAKYRILKNWTLECRFAQLFRSDVDVIGTTLEATRGHARTEIKFQFLGSF